MDAARTPCWAVCGPTGAGKSSFCRDLAARGAVLIEADRVGHELLLRPAIRTRLLDAFGPGIDDGAGGIDRRSLGALVFRDPAARLVLDRTLHPTLAAVLTARLAAARLQGPPLVILEAAVYFLLPGPPPVDMTVAVTAPAPVRLARLVAKGLTPDAAGNRIAAQAHLDATWRFADRTIDNEGSPAILAGLAATLWSEIVAPQSRRGRPHA
jgi:dephospho-CoA kinase